MRNNDRLVVIGDRFSKRTMLLLKEAESHGFETVVSSYEQLLTGDLPEIEDPAALVRLESPGENLAVARLILKSGIAPMEERGCSPIGTTQIDEWSICGGNVIHPLQWYLGFARIVQQIDHAWANADVRWMNSPQSILTAFDKQACLDRWSAAGIPIATGYSGIKTYSQLRSMIPDRHARVFIKSRFGYSAIGAVALEWRDGLVRAITTADVVWNAGRPRLIVSKRPRTLHREFEIALLIDTLAMEDIVVERWLPKMRWQGRPFDLRIVTIGGEARHVVGRASDSPFTNLNLGAKRIDRDTLEGILEGTWRPTLDVAEQAAAQIGSGYFGIDVLVKPGGRECVVLEANAFGDYLPGLLHEGETTFAAELRLLGLQNAMK